MTSTMDDIAARLYGSPSPGAQPPTAQPVQPPTAQPTQQQQQQQTEHVGAGNTPRTEDDLAEAMYGPNGTMRTPQKAQAPAEAEQPASEPQKPRSQDQLAEDMYRKPDPLPDLQLPQGLKEAREADTARQIYSPQVTYRNDLTEAMLDEVEGASSLSAPMRAAVLAESREIAGDLGLSRSDIDVLRRVDQTVKATPPTEETRAGWREQAVERLNAEYGQNAKQALRDARAFIARDPRLAKALDAGGRGDHPDTVLTLARLARRARAEGRLK